MKTRVVLGSAALIALFAFMFVPAVSAATYTGNIGCLDCGSGNTIALNGPGTTGTAQIIFYGSNAPVGTSMTYYVCLSTSTSCSASYGSSNGWSWVFCTSSTNTPCASTVTSASGTVDTCTYATITGTCEGNGYGNAPYLELTLTAPPAPITSSNNEITLQIYACSQSGTYATCNGQYVQVAANTIAATVPEFGLGMGLAVAIGLFGLLFMARKRKLALPTISVV